MPITNQSSSVFRCSIVNAGGLFGAQTNNFKLFGKAGIFLGSRILIELDIQSLQPLPPRRVRCPALSAAPLSVYPGHRALQEIYRLHGKNVSTGFRALDGAVNKGSFNDR